MLEFLRRWLGLGSGVGVPKPTPQPVAVYNTYDARNLFSHLLRRVRAGETIVIARLGEPIATIIPYQDVEELRPGLLRVHLLVNDGARPEAVSSFERDRGLGVVGDVRASQGSPVRRRRA